MKDVEELKVAIEVEKQGPNWHIFEYLNHYVMEEEGAPYAILIDGRWGSGKTKSLQLWRDILAHESKVDKDLAKLKPLYVSLYGVSEISDIQDALFAQLHPMLNSEPMRTASMIVGDLVKRIADFSLMGLLDVVFTEDNVEMITSAAKKGLNNWLRNVDKRTLVFDDLERCAIELDVVLGYINSLVEHGGCRVIILANEGEIKETGEADVRYHLIKEKLIGKSFYLEPHTEAAINSFLSKIGDEKIRDALSLIQSDIVAVHEASKTENLRSLEVFYYDVVHLMSLFSSETRNRLLDDRAGSSEREFLKGLILQYAFWVFEIRAGRMQAADLNKVYELAKQQLWQGKCKRKKKNGESANKSGLEEVAANLLATVHGRQEALGPSTLPIDLWEQLLAKKWVREKDLEKAVQVFVDPSGAEAWEKLLDISSLTDVEYRDIWSGIVASLKERSEKRPGVLLHIFGTQIYLAKEGVGEYSTECIMEYAFDYFNKIAASRSWPVDISFLTSGVRFQYTHYAGEAFLACDLKEFHQLVDKVNESINEQLEVMLYESARQDTITNINNVDWLYVNLTRIQGTGRYSRHPVLKRVNFEEFWARFRDLSPVVRQFEVLSVFKYRYENCMPQEFVALQEERPFVAKLKARIESEYSASSPPSRLAKKELLERIDGILQILGKSVDPPEGEVLKPKKAAEDLEAN